MSSGSRRLKRQKNKRGAQKISRQDSKGRTHLAVVHLESGQSKIEMTEPVFRDDWQNQIASATANTCYSMMREDSSPAGVAALGRKVTESGSTLIDGLLQRAPPGSLACSEGCDHCCHQSVGVTPPEALAIFEFLVEHLDSSELEEVHARVRATDDKTRGLKAEQRVSPELPCPLLDGGRCTVYPVRPLSCRGMNSLDEDACRRRLFDPEVRRAYFAGELPGHSFQEPTQAFHAVSAGLQLSLSEIFGLDMRPLDLNAVLRIMLDDADKSGRSAPRAVSRAQRWVRGEAALSEARGGDASDQTAQWQSAGVRST